MKLLNFISEDFSCFFKELWGIYNVIQYIHWHYTVYHTASLTYVLQNMHSVLLQNKTTDILVITTETVHCFCQTLIYIYIYEGCPSKLWTFVIKRDFLSGIL